MGAISFFKNRISVSNDRNIIISEIRDIFKNKYLNQEIDFQVKVAIPLMGQSVNIDNEDRESDKNFYHVIEIEALSNLNSTQEEILKKIVFDVFLNKIYARKLRCARLSHLVFIYNGKYFQAKIESYI